MVKAVVFDLDGVYFEGGTEKFIESLITKYGISKDAIVAVYLKSEEMQKYKRGEIDSDTFWQYAIKEWNITATRDELVEMLISSYSTNPETVRFVKELRQAGIKTAICTNNFPDRFENLETKFELDKHFDVIVTSYEEGITKPSDKIFRILSNRLGLEPSEIVMSDDREANVDALQRLGFEPFLYQGLEDFKARINDLLASSARNFPSNNPTPDIIKIASLPLNKEGHLLIVKPKDKEIWISLGGKIEEGETDEQCLRREIKEELNVEANGDMKHFVDTPIEPAANEPDKTVLIRFYLLEVPGNLWPDNDEIEDYKWISKSDFNEIKTNKSIKIGSGLEMYAIPKLIEEGLLK